MYDFHGVLYMIFACRMYDLALESHHHTCDTNPRCVTSCCCGLVQSDDLLDLYTNRPFARLFEAIRSVRQRLNKVFQVQADWPPEPKKGGPNITRRTSDEIDRLLQEGHPVADVAQQVGVSRMAVYRRRDRAGASSQQECESNPSGSPS